MNPFDYVTSINLSKKDIMVDDLAEKTYQPFLVNKSLSYFMDTILHVNEMNIHHHIDNRLQFDYLINTVRKQKRFSKWHKKAAISNDVEVVKTFYGYNTHRAEEALKLLSKDQISELRNKVRIGGK